MIEADRDAKRGNARATAFLIAVILSCVTIPILLLALGNLIVFTLIERSAADGPGVNFGVIYLYIAAMLNILTLIAWGVVFVLPKRRTTSAGPRAGRPCP